MDVFELYKLLVEEVREARKARRDLSNAFLTLNVGGVGALGFLAKGEAASLRDWSLLAWLCGALAFTCWIWRTTNVYYTHMLRSKYEILYAVEDRLGEHPIRDEYDLVRKFKPNRNFFSLEYAMPALFIFGYGMLLVYTADWTALAAWAQERWTALAPLLQR